MIWGVDLRRVVFDFSPPDARGTGNFILRTLAPGVSAARLIEFTG